MIIFENVNKVIKKTNILENINLTIRGQEFICIVGESGAGKSTILKLITGEDIPTSGEVSVDSLIVSKMTKKTLQLYRRKCGVVFQDYKLLNRKTVYENIAFAMEACDYKSSVIKYRVPRILKLVGLEGKEKRYPSELSGGEQQRVSIARALIHQPKLLLADEATGNLDQKNAEEIVRLLQKINELGTTVIITTHNVNIVKKLKTRIIVLQNGRIVSDKKSISN
jgi:cell division transport system ATP-binding protein